MDPSNVQVIVVDDDAFTRTLVVSLLTSFGYKTVLSTASVSEAMVIAHEAHPELGLLDLDLGEGPTGIDLAHGLRRLNPGMAIVLLTSYADPTWMGQHREPPLGTRYVVKGEMNDSSVLADALRRALAEPLAIDSLSRQSPPLSEGQWEVLRLVAAGYTNSEIARRRSLTEDAVNKSVSRLVRQLNIDVGPAGNARVLLAKEFNRLTGTLSERRT